MTALALHTRRTPETGSPTGSVHSWDISTGQDGPGLRFVLFTSGCPLACAYCHNPDTQTMRNGRPTTAAASPPWWMRRWRRWRPPHRSSS